MVNMFTVLNGKIVPRSKSEELALEFIDTSGNMSEQERESVAHAFATLGMLDILPESLARFYSPMPDVSLERAKKSLIMFVYSLHAPRHLGIDLTRNLQNRLFDEALRGDHIPLAEFAANYLDSMTISKQAMHDLIYKYMDPSFVCPDSLLHFRLFAYRNLACLDNELRIFTYAMMWGMCDPIAFANYLKRQYDHPVIQLCQFELVIRLKAYYSREEPIETKNRLIDIFEAVPEAQEHLLGLRTPIGMVEIGGRWYFPALRDILDYRKNDLGFQPEFLHILIEAMQTHAISIRKLDELLGIPTQPLPPLSTGQYLPLTEYMFANRMDELNSYFPPAIGGSACDALQTRCLPYIDILCLISLFGDPTVEFELAGYKFAQALEHKIEQGLTDRIALPKPDTNLVKTYKNLSYYTEVAAHVVAPLGTRVIVPSTIFTSLQIFDKNRTLDRMTEFARRLEKHPVHLFGALDGSKSDLPYRKSSKKRSGDNQDESDTAKQKGQIVKDLEIEAPVKLLGLSFLPAFYITGTVFFNLPIASVLGDLLSFLMFPTTESLFGLIHEFSSAYYTSKGEYFFFYEVQHFSRVVYFNVLHEVLSHCDDVHSLFSLFALHADLKSDGMEARHYFRLLHQKYFSSGQRHALPRGNSDIDYTVAIGLASFAIGEPTDFLELGQTILNAASPGIPGRRIEAIATAHLATIFNIEPMPGARKAGMFESLNVADSDIIRTTNVFFSRFQEPWAENIEAISALLPSLLPAPCRILILKNLTLSALELNLFPINAARLFLEAFEATPINYVLFKLIFVRYFDKEPNFGTILKVCDQPWAPENWLYEDYIPTWQYKPHTSLWKRWGQHSSFNKADLRDISLKLIGMGLEKPMNSEFWE